MVLERLSDELSLDQYLSTHTSEDDLALKQLMEDSERQKRIKKPWLYESSEVETNASSFSITGKLSI